VFASLHQPSTALNAVGERVGKQRGVARMNQRTYSGRTSANTYGNMQLEREWGIVQPTESRVSLGCNNTVGFDAACFDEAGWGSNYEYSDFGASRNGHKNMEWAHEWDVEEHTGIAAGVGFNRTVEPDAAHSDEAGWGSNYYDFGAMEVEPMDFAAGTESTAGLGYDGHGWQFAHNGFETIDGDAIDYTDGSWLDSSTLLAAMS
jgi:hypothetical protein